MVLFITEFSFNMVGLVNWYMKYGYCFNLVMIEIEWEFKQESVHRKCDLKYNKIFMCILLCFLIIIWILKQCCGEEILFYLSFQGEFLRVSVYSFECWYCLGNEKCNYAYSGACTVVLSSSVEYVSYSFKICHFYHVMCWYACTKDSFV